MNKISVGKKGEEAIARYLADRGYTIIERNYRYQKKEVDVIARKGDTLVFVEVKYRKSRVFGGGTEAIGRTKRQSIIQVARAYIARQKLYYLNVRFDVASIDRGRLCYIENAFQVRN